MKFSFTAIGQRKRPNPLAAIGVALAATAAAQGILAAEPPTDWGGSKRVDSKQRDFLDVRPGATLAGYKRIRLDLVEVAFDKRWNPNADATTLENRLSKSEIEAIKTDLVREFREVFAEELAKGGYTLVNDSGEGVLTMKAEIRDLYITAPGRVTSSRSRTLTMDSGHMTLVADLQDSVTGRMLARIDDRQKATETRAAQVTDTASNSADTRMMIARWATALRKGLDAANAKSAPQ